MADALDPNIEAVSPVNIEDQMQSAYLDYAMSVIVSRALPDVRDGLKPVQRRILYSMQELNARPGTAYKKSARIVGDTMGRFHPHSNEPIYDAMVRMAQTFSMRYPLIDGQGNYGSVDGDPPAAMRYTEARLHSLAMEMLADIDKGNGRLQQQLRRYAERTNGFAQQSAESARQRRNGHRRGHGYQHPAA